jgi:nicotinamidase/pyrazinamidase
MKTLIIVDTQNDFMPGGALQVPNGDAIVSIINTIAGKFDLVIATQDWHPENHLSFASNHATKKPFDKIELGGIEQILWPDHCVQGSIGAEFHAKLDLRYVEAIFRKGMVAEIDSYSGFFDNGHLKSTGLAGYLRDKGATELFLCGLAADFCVYYTIRDAMKEGFSVTLIEDATRALDINNFGRIREELLSAGVKIIDHSDID